MTSRTGTVTFPSEHDHANVGPDRREQVVLRRWQNLMEPRETPPADLVVESTRSPAKLKRSNIDTAPFRSAAQQGDSKLRTTTAEPFVNITSRACNCTELLANETFSTVVFLVPHSRGTAGEVDRNGSLIREVVRASLSKSVQVERIYEKGCRCGRNDTTFRSPSTSTVATKTNTPVLCARNDSSGLKAIPAAVDVTRLPKTTWAEKVMPTATFAEARVHLPEGRLQTTVVNATGRPAGTKCPVRVFVKLPGEELPARAKDCRKLWLPEIVHKEETFWECEDYGSTDCGYRAPAGSTRHTLLARESGSFPSENTTHIAPYAWFETMRRTHSTRSTTETSEAAFRRRTIFLTPLAKCGNADGTSPSAPDVRAPKPTECVQGSSNDSWHLSLLIAFHPFGNYSKMANATIITKTIAAESLTPRYTNVAAKSSQTTPETSTRNPVASSLRKYGTTTTHTTPTQYTTVSTAKMTSLSAAGLPPSWSIRCPQYGEQRGANNSLPFILMCAAAALAAPSVACNGSSCDIKKRVAEPVTNEVRHQRSTHYHLHDDYDFVWTRVPLTSTTVRRSLQYRARNGTAFPYPFRDSHFGGRGSTAARKGSSLERKPAIFHEAAPSKPEDVKNKARKMATTESTTYLEIIFGVAGPDASRQRERVEYDANEAARPDVERRQGSKKQARSFVGPAGQPGEDDHQASHPPGRRAAIRQGDAGRDVLSPMNIDLFKSSINVKAVEVDKTRSSECQDARCAANSGKKPLLEQIVVRHVNPPSGEGEYEYYYVYDEPPSVRNMIAPAQNEGLNKKTESRLRKSAFRR
ncbi:hypothetical protein V5799_003614 [Amblyomma americanum]|uniref:Uncharacterized protein n=1 Tax=Amblyomma americanum TaxID=6943 RepID=A0AAQ4D8H0_AMBAM